MKPSEVIEKIIAFRKQAEGVVGAANAIFGTGFATVDLILPPLAKVLAFFEDRRVKTRDTEDWTAEMIQAKVAEYIAEQDRLMREWLAAREEAERDVGNNGG